MISSSGYIWAGPPDQPSARRQLGLEIEAVAQILALFQNVPQERAIAVVLHHRLDQVELVHRDKLQDFGARLAACIAWQRVDDLDMLRRFWSLGSSERVAQFALERGLVGLDEGVEADAGAPVCEGDDGGVADIRVAADQVDQDRRVVDEP